MNESMGSIIAQKRKDKGMTQEQLAAALGITYQAVSKWENGLSSPDISALPLLADLLGISLDELFGRVEISERPSAPEEAEQTAALLPVPLPAEQEPLPWPDDDTLRAVLFIGRHLIGESELPERRQAAKKIEFCYEGPAINVESAFDLHIEGEVQGSVRAGGDVDCGDVGGSVQAEGDVDCSSVGGAVRAGGDVDCGEVSGSVQAGGDVDCGAVGKDVNAGSDVDCSSVGGNVSAGGDVDCGSVGGNAIAGGDLSCSRG